MTSASKAVELQLQMKHNAEELQDFVKDLESWEKDIKQMDLELRNQNGVSGENLFPVRNKNFKKKKKNKTKVPSEKTTEENKKNRIKSYDYEAWGKLDVDTILEELDKEDSTHDSVSAESESEEDGIHIDSQKALAEKEKGNKYFKQGKYDEAIDCYTKGMAADPYNPVLPTNRASKPLKTVIIEEIGNLVQNIDLPATNTISVLETNCINPTNVTKASAIISKKNSSQDDVLPTSDTPRAKVSKIEEIPDTPQSTVHQSFSMKNSTEIEKISVPFITTVLPPIPANSFQLESDFRKLKNSPDMLYQYLKQIEPSLYPKLFQKSLEPDVFNQILKILHDFYIDKEKPSLILEILQRLSELKRFDMAVMFMSESEKKVTCALFNHMEKSGLKDNSVEELKKRYSS
uniref:RNA polymerase II-associated protein 3 n=1 Tax=Monodelphis domestica TaxID=13616 RepID=H9H6B7_MONDO